MDRYEGCEGACLTVKKKSSHLHIVRENNSNGAETPLALKQPKSRLAPAATSPLGHDHDNDHIDDHEHSIDPIATLRSPEIQATLLNVLNRVLRENDGLKKNYERLLSQTLQALLKCLEERDPYTFGHSMRVMEYSLLIGRGAELTGKDLRTLELAAMFHDLGKVGVADCVLLKPGKLTEEEQIQMQAHPVKSGEILGLIDEFKDSVPGVRHHHERVDGMGYPDGLSGKQIPWASRIILVADTFDAMTSTRPYRKALPVSTAYEELERYAGTQFDAELVKIFLHEHRKLFGTKKQAA